MGVDLQTNRDIEDGWKYFGIQSYTTRMATSLGAPLKSHWFPRTNN